jgi:hypothetical protein
MFARGISAANAGLYNPSIGSRAVEPWSDCAVQEPNNHVQFGSVQQGSGLSSMLTS